MIIIRYTLNEQVQVEAYEFHTIAELRKMQLEAQGIRVEIVRN